MCKYGVIYNPGSTYHIATPPEENRAMGINNTHIRRYACGQTDTVITILHLTGDEVIKP